MHYQIVETFERPDKEIIEQALDLYFCLVGSRVGPRYVMDGGIKPLERQWRICGPAFTIRPEFPEDVLMTQLADKYVQPGDIVVVDAGGRTDVAAWGATLGHHIREAGAIGAIIDGAVLVAEVIRQRDDLPVFCRGTVSCTSASERPGWLNVPVICGGVIVNPGDLILGDEDGVVVVPRAWCDALIPGMVQSTTHRPRNGEIPPREPDGEPNWKRSGAEEALRSHSDVEWIG